MISCDSSLSSQQYGDIHNHTITRYDHIILAKLISKWLKILRVMGKKMSYITKFSFMNIRYGTDTDFASFVF